VILAWCTVLRGSEEGREGVWEGRKDGRRKEGSDCKKESEREKVAEIFRERGGKRERERKERERERERERKRERERERERFRKRKRKRKNK